MRTIAIPHTIRPSCHPHRRLFCRPIPNSHGCVLTEDEIWGYATLKLQNPAVAQRLQFTDTRPLFASLRAQHGIYLSFQSQNILCTANNEDLTPISEIIGVACGIATMVAALPVNPNRFSRILITGTRLDFEFRHAGSICQLEVKGTTYGSKFDGMLKKSKRKKGKTRRHFDAAFGAVTLFSTPTRHNCTEVVVVDPPTGRKGRNKTKSPEQAILLRHYLPYLQAVLIQNEFTSWLLAAITAFENGGVPPERTSARPLHRVSETYGAHGRFLGTIFDARMTQEAMTNYVTFDAATAALGDHSTFIGVHSDIVAAIAQADWSRLLSLSWPSEATESATLLPSGVLTLRTELTREEKDGLRASFVSGREAVARRRRLGAG